MKRNLLGTGILALAMVMLLVACPASVTPLDPAVPGVTTDSVAPVVGTVIVESATTFNSTTLTWGVASDATAPASALTYKVVVADAAADIDTAAEAVAVSDADVVQDWTVGLLTVTVGELAASTTYYFAVVVRDLNGNVNLYAPEAVTTAAPPPAPVTVGGGTYDANWDDYLRADATDALAGPDISAVGITNDDNNLYICVQLVGGANKNWNNAAYVLIDKDGNTSGMSNFSTGTSFSWGNKNFTTSLGVDFGFFGYGDESGSMSCTFSNDTSEETAVSSGISYYFDTTDLVERYLEVSISLATLGIEAGDAIRIVALENGYDSAVDGHIADVAPDSFEGPVANTVCPVDSYYTYVIE